ncbi:TatD family hydrolase [Alkalibacter mobilis]|uniref:TatD family hydrolase n=1 Tax=Alkalibacter mobilis TaxID=2787712 RepID=UPI00189CD877|nr:TatD family hydrolase [Alkalibacter mobilis]MBF7097152.1 TatD family hydrolase [Alkalibacter mobilis]
MYVDAHTHLEQFEDKIGDAINKMEKDKIMSVACSMNPGSYEYSKKFAEGKDLIIPAFGIHPWEAHKFVDDLDVFDSCIMESQLIGEIGLDFYWITNNKFYSYQRKVFEYMLSRCQRYEKSPNMHTKGAESEILEYLMRYEIKNPIIHWYSGPRDVFEKLVDRGCYFTIGVDVYNSKITRDLVKSLPKDKILTETDGPDALKWINGKRGYPSEIKKVVREISILLNMDEEEIKSQIYDNLTKILSQSK